MDEWAVVAGCLALTSVALALFEITMHMCNLTKPYLQRYIIRILLMVPIYSLNAWFAMIVPSTGLYLDSMREVYESFVIYSFMKYLLNFLNYDTNLQQYIDHKPGPAHIPPICCLPNCTGGRRFLLRCKHGILQYVIIRPITTLLAFISQQIGIYGEGNYNPLSGYTYPVLLLVNNASQILAMYCLVIFYTGYQHELRPMKPLAKFFSIKLVVFFSFFQSVVISGLLEIEIVRETLEPMFPDVTDKVGLGRKLQELLICFDMLIAAVGHLFAFTYKPFTEPDFGRAGRRNGLARHDASRRVHLADDEQDQDESAAAGQNSCCGALCSILDFSEDKRDFSEHFSQIYAKILQVFSFGDPLPTIVPGAHSEGHDRQMSDDWLVQVNETNGDRDNGVRGSSSSNNNNNNNNNGTGAGGNNNDDANAAEGPHVHHEAAVVAQPPVRNYQSI